jgi:hypothetical protein
LLLHLLVLPVVVSLVMARASPLKPPRAPRDRSFALSFQGCQSLRQSTFKVSSPFLERPIEDIIFNEQAAAFDGLKPIDIAVFECTFGEC